MDHIFLSVVSILLSRHCTQIIWNNGYNSLRCGIQRTMKVYINILSELNGIFIMRLETFWIKLKFNQLRMQCSSKIHFVFLTLFFFWQLRILCHTKRWVKATFEQEGSLYLSSWYPIVCYHSSFHNHLTKSFNLFIIHKYTTNEIHIFSNDIVWIVIK